MTQISIHLPRIGAAIALTICALDAQTRGSLSGRSTGLIDAHSHPGSILLKGEGDAQLNIAPVTMSVSPAALALSNAPYYHIGQILPGTGPGEYRINAMSTGQDNLPVKEHASGDYIVDPGIQSILTWAFILFGVASGSEGDQTYPENPLVDRYQNELTQINTPGEPRTIFHGADVYSYYFFGSTGIPDQYIDRAWFEIGSEHIDATHQVRDVQALDSSMLLLVNVDGPFPNPSPIPTLSNPQPDFLFSLSSETVDQHGGTNPLTGPVGSPFQGLEFTAATVYRTTWDAAQGVWGPVQVAFGFQVLDLDEGDDIDALAVRYNGGTTNPGNYEWVIFSLDTNIREQQLLASRGDGVKKILRDSLRRPVVERIGLGQAANLDSLCGSDPELTMFGPDAGTPVEWDAPAVPLMQLSVSLDSQPNAANSTAAAVSVSGWGMADPASSGLVRLRFRVDPVLTAANDFRLSVPPILAPDDYLGGVTAAFRAPYQTTVQLQAPHPGVSPSLLGLSVAIYAEYAADCGMASCPVLAVSHPCVIGF